MKFARQLFLLTLVTCTGLALSACEPSTAKAPAVPVLSSLAVSPGTATVEIGRVQPLTVTGTYSDGSTLSLTSVAHYSSSATSVAVVNSAGVVTAIKAGTATVTAAVSGVTGTATITVPQPALVSIAVTPLAATLQIGASQQLTVTGTYEEGSRNDVTAESTFASSNAGVATVDASGQVLGVAEGTATITATHTATGETASASVEVVPAGLVELVNGVWSSNYSQLAPASWKSAENGDAGVYIDGSVPTAYWWNGVAPNDATPSFYFGYGIDVNAKPWGFGAFVKAPGNAAADVSGYTNVKIAVWGNDQLMSTNPTLTVVLRGPPVAGCAAEVRGSIDVQAIGAQTYTLSLDGFVLQTGCAFTTAAEALAAGVAEVHIQVLGDNVQYVSGNDGSYYPNGLNVGPISFNSEAAGPTVPVAAAPVPPAREAADVLSVYSGAYTQIAGVDLFPFWGQTTVGSVVPIAGNDTLKYETLNYQGIDFSGAPIDVSSMESLHLDVWTADVTTLKVSIISAGLENAVTLTPTAAGWNSFDIDLADYTVPDKTAIIQLKFEGAPAGGTVYLDNIYFWKSAAGVTPIVFASGYASNNRTVEGGEWGFYSGNFTNYSNTYAGGGFVDGAPPVPAADSYIYLVVATSAPTADGYMGIFTAAPGYTIANPNAGVTLSGQTQLKLELGQTQEWFDQGVDNQLVVRLLGAQVYSDGGGGTCRIQLDTQLTPTTAGLITYSIDLNSLTLTQSCNGGGFTSGVTDLAQALTKPIAEIHVQAVYPQLNTTVSNGAEYPTGFTRGAVWFQ
jgi:hypothetical protein